MSTNLKHTFTRREMLRMIGLGAAGTLLAACGATPTPQVVKETVEVEKIVTKEVEKIVRETVEVEKVVTPTPAPQGPVTLEFWQPFGDLGGPAIDTVVKTWNERNPDIQVKVTFTPNVTSAGTNPKFLSAALSGNPPDVFIHDGSSFSTSTALNAFTQLDELVAATGLKPETYFKWAWEKVQWAGHTYGLPLNTDARALYSNTKLLQEAGFSKPPTTIDELDAMADKLTKKSGDRYEQMGFIPWIGNWFLIAWGWDFGVNVWDAAANQIHLNAPEMVAALEWEVTYAKKYGVNELQAFQAGFGSGANDPFRNGQVAMVANGDWEIASLKQYVPDLEYEITPVPYPAGRQAMTWSGGFVTGIPRGSKHPEETWKFIVWLTGAEAASTFAKIHGSLPCNVEAAQAMTADDPLHRKFVDLLPVSFIEPVIPEWSLAWDQHIVAEQAAIYLQKTAQEALDEANAKVQEAIDLRVTGG